MSDIYEIIDPKFRDLIHETARVKRLHTGMLWAEGPVYFVEAECLLWSDIPNDRMLRWHENEGVSIFRQPANYSNGNTQDRQGRLVTCEHGERRVTRTELNGHITVLADSYQGKRLNSPNDVVVKSDGSIWFTDPPYGILTDYEGHKAEMEQNGCHVYCRDSVGKLNIVADDFDKPNGIAFSPDESFLYISDTGKTHNPQGPHHIRVFRISPENRLSGGNVFAEITPGLADGFRLDVYGNLWTSAGDGVHCYSPAGSLLGKILIPETVSNLCFGGRERNRLFITATTSLYTVSVACQGVNYV
ncbi:MAG: SMP-30/gluconolactonase/LRE family protein [Alphaproteobacteria bacterium]